jgi:glucosamine--fructose-6-phosphate aminotransferase (isomerizing)
MAHSEYTRVEIWSQPAAWDAALDAVDGCRGALLALGSEAVPALFTGCGSTYYLSLASAALFQQLTGRAARAIPAGELLLHPQSILTSEKTLLVAVSRSGSTSETLRAVEQYHRQGRGPVVAITNYADQPLAGMADAPVVIEAGQEKSMAQTRSFASMYVAAAAMAALLGGHEGYLAGMRRLPACGTRLINDYDRLAQITGADLSLDRFYFLGSGIRYGLACEVSLKMKEMTLSHSEPFHFLEFRHGPKAMVTPDTLVVGLLSESQRRHEQQVLDEMAELGGRVLSLGEAGAGVRFDSGVDEALRGVLYLPVLQMMAYHRALAKGLDADSPTNLTAVVKLAL